MEKTGLIVPHHRSPPASTAAHAALTSPRGGYPQHRPQLQHLPIARDRVHGKSPLQHMLSVQSPRSVSHVSTPKAPSSPAVQLLQSLTLAEKRSTKPQTELAVQEKHALERCLQKEALRECSTWQDAFHAVVKSRGQNSIVACEGSPTARVLNNAFPECRASKYSMPEAALSALEDREAHRALLPVESSLHGTVHRTYDLLLRYSNVQIVGELVATQQQLLEDMSVEGEHGRFWMLSKDAAVLPSNTMTKEVGARFKTTVAMVLREGLGALHKALAAFAFRDIAVSKVESRPWRAQPLGLAAAAEADQPAGYEDGGVDSNTSFNMIRFQYVVFIDFEGSLASRLAQNALVQLQEHAAFLRVLGSYPCFHPCTSTLPMPIQAS